MLRTACLAHWEAVQALLEQGYELAGMSAYALVEELAVLIMGGPPALAISPAIQALLSEAVPRLQQVGLGAAGSRHALQPVQLPTVLHCDSWPTAAGGKDSLRHPLGFTRGKTSCLACPCREAPWQSATTRAC